MFRIEANGWVTRELFRPTSHEARVMEAVQLPQDFVTLAKEARIAELLPYNGANFSAGAKQVEGLRCWCSILPAW